MEKLSYQMGDFQGPLDLLLHLIAKHKLNIFEIEIAVLLEQYLAQIEQFKQQEMEISSEFLEMAARLVYLKTVSLLPKNEEAKELQRELEGQLLDYQQYQQAAVQLGQALCMDRFFRQPQTFAPDHTYRRTHTADELLLAYRNAIGRGRRFLPPPVERFSGIVARRMVSVPSQAVVILRRLRRERQVEYAQLFEGIHDRSQMVAAFLAVLELVKGKRIQVVDREWTSVVMLKKSPEFSRKEEFA